MGSMSKKCLQKNINEQFPDVLKTALNKYFRHVLMWTGYITEIDANKSEDESGKENRIFEFACNEQSIFDRVIGKVTVGGNNNSR